MTVGAFRYRTEVLLFVGVAVALAFVSSQRFWRQSEAPHFVYQAKAWLEGRVDVDPKVLPNIEDWACVRREGGAVRRCEGPLAASDTWYVSFPPFPALAMLPFVAVQGYQFNDTSFTVLVGALAVALFFRGLRKMGELEKLERSVRDDVALALLFAFGTLFLYCSIRGEVWFSAEVLGVALTCAYVGFALQARSPLLAGLFFSMAVLTRTPLLFTGVFFVMEAVCPTAGKRLDELKAVMSNKAALKKLGLFTAGAAPLALGGAILNIVRFGSPGEFGHRFFYNNRVNVDIDTYGLFNLAYLGRNLDAAFFLGPLFGQGGSVGYNPHGLSLWLTLPFLALLIRPKVAGKGEGVRGWFAVIACLALVLGRALVGGRPQSHASWVPDLGASQWVTVVSLLVAAAPFVVGVWNWKSPPRLLVPLMATVFATALPGLLYQNDGYAQFGFRFSLDYTPYLMWGVALSGWTIRDHVFQAVAALAVAVNVWGAAAFNGYTEMMRRW